MMAAELKRRRPVARPDGRTVPTIAVIPSVACMIFSSGASAQRCTSLSRNQSSDVYPWMLVSGSTTRSEFSFLACSIARIILTALFSKSPLMVLIWPMVTRIFLLILHDPRQEHNSTGLNRILLMRYIQPAHLAEGSHNGSAAVLKTAGRKAMQVRVLSPPPFASNNLPFLSLT